ncbi:MAG: diguanylate cyclase [Methylophilaceae bacterium]
MSRLRTHFKSQHLSFFLAMAVVPVLLWLFHQSSHELAQSRAWVSHSNTVLTTLDHIRIDAGAVEGARRGYFITKQDSYLPAYFQAKKTLPRNLADLKSLTSDNPDQQGRIDQLMPIISELLSMTDSEISGPSYDASQSGLRMAHARELLEQVRSLYAQMSSEEEVLLRIREQDTRNKMHNLSLWLIGISLIFISLIIMAFVNGQREIKQRRLAEAALLESEGLNQLTVRNLSLMGEMTSLLQACSDADESLDVICQYAARLLNTDSGALFLFRESRNQVELSVSWGEESKSDVIFQPEDCWALRRGELHVLDHVTHSIACRHLQDWGDICSVCVPIVAQGNVMGTLYLENRHNREIRLDERNLAQNLANQIALAMSSIKLRDTLRNLSVRDPLTGLFNRRYMEESLQREIATAKRKNRPLGLVILDLDHFKTFNDTFGHDAGDLLLREVGTMLAKNSRAGDVACRFGGEEFVIIFPEAAPNIVMQLTNQLRETIFALQLQHFGRSLGQVSASFGVAAFPEHGSTTEDLLRAADKALYRAKAAGRNRVEMAGSHAPAATEKLL